jgi:hypothetical protein
MVEVPVQPADTPQPNPAARDFLGHAVRGSWPREVGTFPTGSASSAPGIVGHYPDGLAPTSEGFDNGSLQQPLPNAESTIGFFDPEYTPPHYCPVKSQIDSISYFLCRPRNCRASAGMQSIPGFFRILPPKRPASMCGVTPRCSAASARWQPKHTPTPRSRFASSRRSPTFHRTA